MDKHGRLKKARQAAGLSQGDLANAIGIAQSQISRMEAGTKWASNEVIEKIAKRLSIPISTLFDVDLQPNDKRLRTDSPKALLKNDHTPPGLRELAEDKAVQQAMNITALEWHFLATLQLPSPTHKSGYLTLLTAMRGVTNS